jgi:hypothetical protein
MKKIRSSLMVCALILTGMASLAFSTSSRVGAAQNSYPRTLYSRQACTDNVSIASKGGMEFFPAIIKGFRVYTTEPNGNYTNGQNSVTQSYTKTITSQVTLTDSNTQTIQTDVKASISSDLDTTFGSIGTSLDLGVSATNESSFSLEKLTSTQTQISQKLLPKTQLWWYAEYPIVFTYGLLANFGPGCNVVNFQWISALVPDAVDVQQVALSAKYPGPPPTPTDAQPLGNVANLEVSFATGQFNTSNLPSGWHLPEISSADWIHDNSTAPPASAIKASCPVPGFKAYWAASFSKCLVASNRVSPFTIKVVLLGIKP